MRRVRTGDLLSVRRCFPLSPLSEPQVMSPAVRLGMGASSRMIVLPVGNPGWQAGVGGAVMP